MLHRSTNVILPQPVAVLIGAIEWALPWSESWYAGPAEIGPVAVRQAYCLDSTCNPSGRITTPDCFQIENHVLDLVMPQILATNLLC
jgi:hypothetical protein